MNDPPKPYDQDREPDDRAITRFAVYVTVGLVIILTALVLMTFLNGCTSERSPPIPSTSTTTLPPTIPLPDHITVATTTTLPLD